MKSVLLTGAAGGIGSETLRLLVEAGYRTYAGAIDDWEMSELNRLRRELNTDRIIPVMLDLRDREQIDSVVSRIEAEAADSFAALIPNGAACPVGTPFELSDLDSIRDVMETNYFGNLHLMLRAANLLKRNKSRVVYVSSMWGLIPAIMAGPYSASKHACEALFATIRRELAPFGVKVIITNPGGVKHTYMVAEHYHGSRDYLARLRGCTPEEICSETRDRGKNSKLQQPKIKDDRFYDPHYQLYMEATRDATSEDKLKFIATARLCALDIMKGVQSPHPKLRYLTGWDCKVLHFLKRYLPERWFEKLLVAAMLPRKYSL